MAIPLGALTPEEIELVQKARAEQADPTEAKLREIMAKPNYQITAEDRALLRTAVTKVVAEFQAASTSRIA